MVVVVRRNKKKGRAYAMKPALKVGACFYSVGMREGDKARETRMERVQLKKNERKIRSE